MTFYQSVISGIVQGLTEFLPISSSGHLVILHSLFRIDKPQLDFDIVLHLGTLAAVIYYFRRDIAKLLTKDRRTAFFIVIGTLPAAVVGILARESIDRLFVMPKLVSAMLILTGLWLGLASAIKFYYKKTGYRKPLGLWNALLIGLAQAAAIMPGVSRSGSTIATGISLGLEAEEAFRFSFLLSIPAVAGAALLKLPKALGAVSWSRGANFLIGGFTAAIVGLLALKLLSSIIKADRLYVFSIYCLVVGSLGIILF